MTPTDRRTFSKTLAGGAYMALSASRVLGANAPDFSKASEAAKRFMNAGAKVLAIQKAPPQDAAKLNQALIAAERALLSPQGLPNRPWFRHLIYAPGFYTGYGTKTLPGVREGIEEKRYQEAEKEIIRVAKALQDYADAIDSAAADLDKAGH